jgi:hypothetical protein
MDPEKTGRGNPVAGVIGLILVVVGGYYVLRNTIGINLPELDSSAIVPMVAVAVGFALLYRASRPRTTTIVGGRGEHGTNG